ncbi:hypothetical protein ATCV1_z789L [Acanthocystis turfacea chlorella virus 1]|uniref:Uncharacterized protein z789L n=1 Tax=Chlorovirus heliozoae TaxID=322019 RepID=A7KA49_9PHYC|nr:hypothetical protein ATCV1_z789L [Acanthocystis turfacea chlorella virus 1]ABT16923.1 hypothetical protein ATCV1_z789L [Acanthocystis turfacea chlorella virus 1]
MTNALHDMKLLLHAGSDHELETADGADGVLEDKGERRLDEHLHDRRQPRRLGKTRQVLERELVGIRRLLDRDDLAHVRVAEDRPLRCKVGNRRVIGAETHLTILLLDPQEVGQLTHVSAQPLEVV